MYLHEKAPIGNYESKLRVNFFIHSDFRRGHKMFGFKSVYMASQFFGLVVVTLTVFWVDVYLKIVWDLTNIRIYNWHPIFMVIGMVFLYGNCKFDRKFSYIKNLNHRFFPISYFGVQSFQKYKKNYCKNYSCSFPHCFNHFHIIGNCSWTCFSPLSRWKRFLFTAFMARNIDSFCIFCSIHFWFSLFFTANFSGESKSFLSANSCVSRNCLLLFGYCNFPHRIQSNCKIQ